MASGSESYRRIYAVVRKIPRGRLATYGQVAGLAGLPGQARQVGYVDPVDGACHFEVHVAKVVFHALDITEDGVLAVLAGDQPHGDTGYRL